MITVVFGDYCSSIVIEVPEPLFSFFKNRKKHNKKQQNLHSRTKTATNKTKAAINKAF